MIGYFHGREKSKKIITPSVGFDLLTSRPTVRGFYIGVILKIARVFPRRTKATPIDELSFIGDPYLLFPPEVDRVNISVTFTWDLKEAERLEKEWSVIAPVEIGGPATGMRGEDFLPREYLKPGYVITSRGCRNRCWFCSVWKREGDIRELPIMEGNNILDDNLLACSDDHVKAVFNMLSRQKEKPQFTGGLEAAILKEWHVKELKKLKPKTLFFAYDTPDDLEPLREAGKLLLKHGFTKVSHCLRAYVLIGYPKDTFEKAEKRLYETIDAGFFPMSMLFRDHRGDRTKKWVSFNRQWANHYHVGIKIRELKIIDNGKTINLIL